jgi:hypothetical protein
MAEKTLIIEVTPLDIKIEEVSNYEFKFKATEFANNEAVKNWMVNNEKIIFSDNFDWINGGLKSGVDDVGPYFKIQAGSWMEIPYKLFNTNLFDTGANFKIIFKAFNCRDYDASVVECIT